MHAHTKQKIRWMVTGALVGAGLSALITCCCGGAAPPPPPPAPMCADAAPPPVATPAPEVDASCTAPDASPAPFDAGPSCGTHPWSKDGRCCRGSDCNT